VRSSAEIEVVLWCPGQRAYPELETVAVAAAARAGRAYRISERTLARIQPDATSPALLSVVRLPRWDSEHVLGDHARLVLVADGIEYAGNLGTLVRTADACAADALVLTRATARVTHPKVFAASRGTVLTTPVLTFDTVAEARRRLAGAGFTAYVADPAGLDQAVGEPLGRPHRTDGVRGGGTDPDRVQVEGGQSHQARPSHPGCCAIRDPVRM